MKNLFVCICCTLCLGANAQETVTKSYPAKAGQQIHLKFDYPVVQVSTWDKNEVGVIAHVNINDHENDSALELTQSIEGDEMTIKGSIKGIDKLPRRYTIVHNGIKRIYKTRSEYDEARKEGGVQQSYEGSDIKVTVEVKIPAQCSTQLNSTYGIVELTNFNAPIKIDATYGGIDATISTPNTGKLQATTRFGQIYSNLDMHITQHEEHDFFNSITTEPGKGPTYIFISNYGKIYLRKP
jgi:hypothetical protein